jgi:raffinose/stachyose/melibiose transport system permease protein
MTTPKSASGAISPARRLAGRGITYGLMAFVIVMSVGPFVWVVMSSLKTNVEVLGSPLSLPTTLNLEGYVTALTRTQFPRFFLNSMIASAGGTALAIGVFGMGAWALARRQFPGARWIYALLISTLLISLLPMLQPITLVIRNLGLYDTLWALILIYAAKGLPITIFILHSYFKTIPRDLEEAAGLDGASMWQTYRHVGLPLARPAIAAASVLIFLNAWNDFLFPLLVTQSEDTRTLSYALRFFMNAFAQDYPTLLAAVVLTLIPSVVVYVALQEQVQKSLVGGAVRG